MGPFKVVKCRYFDPVDGSRIPPYCQAGPRCKFIHPEEKEWVGLDTSPKLRAIEFPAREATEIGTKPTRATPRPISNVDDTQTGEDFRFSTNTILSNSHIKLGQIPGPAISLASTIRDVSRYQRQTSETEQQLAKAREKLVKFEELAGALRDVSPPTFTILSPIIEKLRTERCCLEKKIEEDMGKLTQSWEDALNVFLRAVCQQFDREVEAGSEYLHQEARILFKTLSHKRTTSILSGGPSSKMAYPLEYPVDAPSVDIVSYTPKQSKSGSGTDETRSNCNCAESIARIQEQIDKQSEKIESLLHRNSSADPSQSFPVGPFLTF